jgi:hypothetical protein
MIAAVIAAMTLAAACGGAAPAQTPTVTATSTTTTTLTTITPTTTSDGVATTTLETTTTTEGVAGQIVQVVFAAEDQSDCSNVTAFNRLLMRQRSLSGRRSRFWSQGQPLKRSRRSCFILLKRNGWDASFSRTQ